MRERAADTLRGLAEKLSPSRPVEQWVVRYGNYEPAEIDSTWPTEAEANARVAVLDSQNQGGMWEVEQWQ